MAYLYSPRAPAERAFAITFNSLLHLLALAFLGLLCGAMVVDPLPDNPQLLVCVAWALLLGDFMHIHDGLRPAWSALVFAIGFDLGALLLPA